MNWKQIAVRVFGTVVAVVVSGLLVVSIWAPSCVVP